MIAKRIKYILLMLILVATASPALAASGVEGRVAWRGELVPGVTIRAYRSITDIAAKKPVASSQPTALDGTYNLELPPGRYYLTARDFDDAPEPGRYFCYYSGSPVQVNLDGFTQVGFNLIKVPQEPAVEKGKRSGLKGEITYQGEPLSRVYLYVYKDPSGDFKGPAYQIVPVERGSFRLRLPPGEYYLLARKRAAGGRYGPIEIGDYFNYYYANPVRIDQGETRHVRIETITRLSMLEGGESPPFSGVRGKVVGGHGRPAAGVRVFAYRDPAMTGTPAYFSPPTRADGNFELPVPETGTFYLLARESFGGPAGEGELYGRLSGADGSAVTVGTGDAVEEVLIHVEPK